MKNRKGFILVDTLIALALCCISMMLILSLSESELHHRMLLQQFDEDQLEYRLRIASERGELPVCTPEQTPLPEKEEAS